jgi:predicted permease
VSGLSGEDWRAFAAEALDEAWRTRGVRGVLLVLRVLLRDAIAIRLRPAGLPITAAPISVGTSPHRSGRPHMDRLFQDLRFAAGLMRRQPGFTLAAVLTLALGVGANTAIFNVAWQAILKPLPYPDSHELVEVWETTVSNGRVNLSTPAKFRDAERESTSFAAVAAFGGIRSTVDLTGSGEPEQLRVRMVSGEYFRIFGTRPIVGRGISGDDERNGRAVVVISEGLWRRRFQQDRAIVGSTLRFGRGASEIIGVMPASFTVSAGDVDVWTPIQLPPADAPRLSGHYLRVIARLRPGVTVEAADAELRSIAARKAAAFPESDGALSATVRSLAGSRGTASTRSGLAMLAIAAGAVLLIACANLASLQLARGVSRAREFAVRAALGASRGRLVRQMLTESAVIAVVGALAGLALGVWVSRLLASMAPVDLRLAATASPDEAVMAYGLTLAAVSALIFATAPAWRTATGATRWLRQRTGGGDRASSRARTVLVTAQIAAACVLLVGAALLISSLANVLRVDPGFKPEGTIAFDVTTSKIASNDYAAHAALFTAIGREVGALPGVHATCALNEVPFDTPLNMTYVPDGRTTAVNANFRTVSPGCLSALGLTLTAGRWFSAQETARVAIVSEGFAAEAWPKQNPLGQRLHEGLATGALIEVVGVVADTLYASLEGRAHPQYYEAWTPASSFWPQRMIVRAGGEPAALFAPLRAAIRRVDPDQPVARLRTLDDMIINTLSARRFNLTLLASFSMVALLLAAIGIYGLLAETVAHRASEIGVRMALGATRGSVVRLIMRHAWFVVGIGLPVGLGAAALASRLLGSFMFGLSARDPRIYLAVAVALAVIVLAAAWLPARRAATIDPVATLR